MTESKTTPAPLKDDEYRCAHCGTVYQCPSFDAKSELEANFPGYSIEQCEIVCDDCFNRMPVKKRSDHWNGLTRAEQEKLNSEKFLGESEMEITNTTKDRYFDRDGHELWPHNILPHMSNVHSVIRTEKMTVEQFKARFPDERT